MIFFFKVDRLLKRQLKRIIGSDFTKFSIFFLSLNMPIYSVYNS